MYDILKKNEGADMNGKYLKLLLASVSVFFLLAETSAKPIASVEYFYAADGTLTGRAVNGKLQQYQYDKKGQLVAVVDALSRRMVEHYVYDPAGNILSKTVNEKTTTYIYDKANQLISSTCEGKVTKYQYDAAGRMVKEGEKSYRYAYRDKILEIQENGRQVAAFDYHMDGQIASAMYDDKSEDFLWDGLALIHRGATNFINEPYVTGGNPILSSKDGVMFNDMLGNSLNIGGKDIAITAFGETESVEAMFTGKPYIGGLGYTFLYRNYRADQGKWQTTDPLGYPDGWNNFAYCNNGVTSVVDRLGTDIYHVYDSDGTWHGHSASIIGNPEDGYKAYNFGGAGGGYTIGNPKDRTYATAQEALAALNNGREGAYEYDKVQKWNTTPEQDRKAQEANKAHIDAGKYGELLNNCTDAVEAALKAAGVKHSTGLMPATLFSNNKSTATTLNYNDFKNGVIE